MIGILGSFWSITRRGRMAGKLGFVRLVASGGGFVYTGFNLGGMHGVGRGHYLIYKVGSFYGRAAVG